MYCASFHVFVLHQFQITENPLDYDAHVELISLLRSLFDLEKLRIARKRMAGLFPLTSTIWMEWLEDENKIATTAEEKLAIVDLFEQAIKDYLCKKKQKCPLKIAKFNFSAVDIWLEYVQFSIGLQAETEHETGVENVRKVFERALTAAGLHVTKGALLWEAFIEFEVVVLSLIQSKGPEAVENQLKRIANLFRRQLSCPLLDMDETYERFNMWLEDNVKSETAIIDKSVVAATYKKSKEKLAKVEKFEEDLVKSHTFL